MIMKFLRIGLVAALALIGALTGAVAQTSNPSNCTLAGCQQSWTQNGIQSFVRTYKYSSIGNVPVATATDLFTISGAAGKTIRITKIVVGGENSSAAAQRGVQIIRRSAANTGGASTAPTPLARDTNNAAATATLALYTANPAGLGTAVGTIDSCRLLLNAAGTQPDVCAFTYGVNDDQLTVLRGATDILAINFLGTGNGVVATATSDFIDIDIEWTEE